MRRKSATCPRDAYNSLDVICTRPQTRARARMRTRPTLPPPALYPLPRRRRRRSCPCWCAGSRCDRRGPRCRRPLRVRLQLPAGPRRRDLPVHAHLPGRAQAALGGPPVGDEKPSRLMVVLLRSVGRLFGGGSVFRCWWRFSQNLVGNFVCACALSPRGGCRFREQGWGRAKGKAKVSASRNLLCGGSERQPG